VPFIVRWPGVTMPGSVSDDMVCSVDVLPTLLDAAGIAAPDDRAIDGLSLVNHLKSGGKQSLGRDELLWHFPHYRHAPGPYSIIRKGDWKLIRWDEGISELYDLKSDLSESTNQAEKRADKLVELDGILTARLKSMNVRMPRLNPQWKGQK
jgi:arylsulfatase A